MKSDEKLTKGIGLVSFIALSIIFIMVIVTWQGELSTDMKDWCVYGNSISSWTMPFLTVINILVLVLLNHQLKRNDELNLNKEYRIKILLPKFDYFRVDFRNAHRLLQESIGFNNQQECFDNWKTIFIEYYNQMVELSPSIKNCEYMEWWLREFDDHTVIINSTVEGEYDPAKYSFKWSPNISKLYSELCNYIVSGK